MNYKNRSIKLLKMCFSFLTLLFGGILIVLISLLGSQQLQVTYIFNEVTSNYLFLYVIFNFILSALILLVISKIERVKSIWFIVLILLSLLVIGDVPPIMKAVMAYFQRGSVRIPLPVLILLIHLWASFALIKVKKRY